MALAPRRDLFGVPSSSISLPSRACWSEASRPVTASAISPLTLATALPTPLPRYSAPPSRSSVASNSPVEAPDGTAARPVAPERSASSTSTVGLPRESRIWRAWTRSMALMVVSVLFLEAGLRVVADLGARAEVVPARAVGLREPLGGLDARAKPIGRGPQRELRVDLELARDVDRGEQQVARRLEARVGVVGGAGLLEDLELARDRVVGRRVDVEAGRGRPALHLAGVQQRREVLGHLAEDPGLAAGLGRLDRVPVAQDLAGVGDLGLPEDVRVAADELLADVLGDVGQRAGAALLEQQRQEVNLEQDVAELVQELGVVAPVRCVGQLVGLFEGVRDDRALVLLT